MVVGERKCRIGDRRSDTHIAHDRVECADTEAHCFDVGGLGRTVALLLAGMMLSGRGWDAALALAAVCLGLLLFRHQPNRESAG